MALNKNIKVGDKVTKGKVMKKNNPIGIVEKITDHYVVVSWEDVNGHWHYTKDQAKQLEVLNE